MHRMSGAQSGFGDFALLSGIVLVVLFLLATMEHHRRKRQAESRRARRPKLAPLKNAALNLSGDDDRVLARLGWLLKNPSNRHRLLEDQALFLRVARKALREGIAGEDELLRLARKAGFSVDQIASDAMSTLKLAAGVEVSVADPAMNSGAGSIAVVHPETLRVRLRRGQTAFSAGTRLDVVCNSNQGLFRFTTSVRGSSGKVLHLEHTDRIQQVQRRSHRRHEIELPVELLGADGTRIAAKTTDLSIGGAAVRNPKRTFAAGGRIVVAVSQQGSRIDLPGDVIRTSRGGRLLHVKFRDLPENTRHRLFRLIMTASAPKRR
jgi:c-di-GMP-binding flagellar brake protein YcgR